MQNLHISGRNHPFVVWASCFLWLTSIFAIIWSLLLFFCVGDMLIMTGTDIVNALVLLLGLLMLPTNLRMMHTIAKGERVGHKMKVVCCPVWICILWIIIISCVGIVLCAQRIYLCDLTAKHFLSHAMKNYRHVPKYKHFVDNVQWSLKCCGLNSYKDWFKQDWYDKIRDYEWDPSAKHKRETKKQNTVEDSVPLSCCKSGSCISNFLLELGTHSIHTKGCSQSIYRIIMISMNAHVMVFSLILITEVILLRYLSIDKCSSESLTGRKHNIHVRQLLPVNNKFEASSSSSCNLDDSCDDLGSNAKQENEKCNVCSDYKAFIIIRLLMSCPDPILNYRTVPTVLNR